VLLLVRRSAGVVEKWSVGILEWCDLLPVSAFLLITDLLVTDYFGSHGIYLRTNGSRPYQSPITNHLSRPSSRSINERARGQYYNQNGSFGSDLPIR